MKRPIVLFGSICSTIIGIALILPLAPQASASVTGIHKIRHVIIIMQENRSFDTYFGTYPGADGIPMKDGVPTVCSREPKTRACVEPFLTHLNRQGGGPHTASDAISDIAGGRMNGFLATAVHGVKLCKNPLNPNCINGTNSNPLDVMGYHSQSDIPNYWAYAKNFVLQDHMFEPVASYSLPSHLYMVSGWSASCQNSNPMSCVSSTVPTRSAKGDRTPFAWTDITYLLQKHGVSWGYFLDHGADRRGANKGPGVPTIWNVLPRFVDVHKDNQLDNVQDLTKFTSLAKAGKLPNVSWIAPNPPDSEHPPHLISRGQSYVTNLINTVMKSPDWDSTAIFLAWDDWGGYYDNVMPPKLDRNGYGIRVPGLVISPYAKKSYIDHQVLSFDAYLKFIENDFLGGARLNPKTDGRPDSRPDVRESKIPKGLIDDFNFNQAPSSPLILPVNPKTTLVGP